MVASILNFIYAVFQIRYCIKVVKSSSNSNNIYNL